MNNKRIQELLEKKLTDEEFAQIILGVSDLEMKHYVPGSLKEEETEEGGTRYVGIFRYSFGNKETE